MTNYSVQKHDAGDALKPMIAGAICLFFIVSLFCFWGCEKEPEQSTEPTSKQHHEPLDAQPSNPPEADEPPDLKTLENILENKILRVGYVNFEPIIFKNKETGEIKGHFAMAVEEIARQMKVKCVYHETTWAKLYKGLREGDFDLSVAPTFGTIPQALSIAITRPLMYVGSSAIVKKKDRRFRSIKGVDQEGIVIAVTEGESGHRYAKTEIKNAEVFVQSQQDQSITFSLVLEGKADIALGGAHMTAQFAAAHRKEVKDLFADEPYNITGVSWAVNPSDQEFLNFINTALNVLESTGKLAEYEQKFDLHWLHPERLWITY